MIYKFKLITGLHETRSETQTNLRFHFGVKFSQSHHQLQDAVDQRLVRPAAVDDFVKFSLRVKVTSLHAFT